MALINVRDLGGGKSQEYVTTGLQFTGRVSYVEGGYYVSGNTVNVDMTLDILSSSGSASDWALVSGFLMPPANAQLNYSGDPAVTQAFIHTDGSLRVYPLFQQGKRMHFYGSYTLAH